MDFPILTRTSEADPVSKHDSQVERSSTDIKRQDFRAVRSLISVHSNQRLAALEEAGLETNDDKLHARPLFSHG